MTDRGLAGVVLAAGEGRRLAPLTWLRPKALCPVNGVPLVDLALGRVAATGLLPASTAVNLHHGAAQLDAHLPSGVHRSFEHPLALGTAGALGALTDWLDGRDVLVTNADAWFAGPLDLPGFVEGWDRQRNRLLCVRAGAGGDFGDHRYCGVALLPASLVAGLGATPSGLYELLWHDAWNRGDLDLVTTDVEFVDCGTPRRYLDANLLASGGRSVVDESATVAADAVLERTVVWDHAEVHPGEHLTDAIRADGWTLLVR